MHNTMVIENFNSKQDISYKTKIKIYINMIKPDFKMHNICTIYTYLSMIIARYWNQSLFIIK